MPFFAQASNFVINGGNFVETTNHIHNHYHGTSGLQLLFDSTIPQAAYDSSARKHAPSCHPNTREQYIKDITSWVQAHNVADEGGPDKDGNHLSSLLWVNGAAGVGKSAVARTSAITLQKTLELGAAFFISSPNRHNDPDKLFTSIAYQLATRLRPATSIYGSVLEDTIRRDPSILTKSPAVQFRELIVGPLLGILSEGGRQPDSDAPPQRHQRALIIIDGLDECAGTEAQCEILRIISQATQDYPDLPLVWAVFSRPEIHIESTIKSFGSLWWNISLPISKSTYKDIEVYLTDNFARIQQQYQLSSPGSIVDDWPSKHQIKALTDRSAGLFIYAATIVRYFEDPRLVEREKQLQNLLLRVPIQQQPSSTAANSPLTQLDSFYTLVMNQIPKQNLSYTHNILFILANELYTGSLTVNRISNLLGYSKSTTLSIINSLRSVLVLENELVSSGGMSSRHHGQHQLEPLKEVKIAAYHFSFIEYLRLPGRSGEFCVFDDECRVFWSRRCLQIISEFNIGNVEGIALSNWGSSGSEEEEEEKSNKLKNQKDLFIEASCSLLGSYAQISNLLNYSDLINPLLALDFRTIVITAGMNVRHLVMSLKEDELQYLIEQFSSFETHHRKPKLIRERLPLLNSITQRYYNLTHKFHSIFSTHHSSSASSKESSTNPSRSNNHLSNSQISSSISLEHSNTSSSSPLPPLLKPVANTTRTGHTTPLRILPTYELGIGERNKVYLYPECGNFGVSYHVCLNAEELEEPYKFPADMEKHN